MRERRGEKEREGEGERDRRGERDIEDGIEAITISHRVGDLNDEQVRFGMEALREEIRVQIAPEEVSRLMSRAT